jgi:hypothetical protein
MEWISTNDRKPLAYMTGLFDGKKSDEIIAKDENGKQYLATYYEGTLDGSKFEDWYDNRDYDIKTKVVAFLEIPE